MKYAILDSNSYYALGVRHLVLRSSEAAETTTGDIRWRRSLLTMDTIIVRCHFSLTSSQQSLLGILSRLEKQCWNGRLYLVCNEQGWALATHLRKRFSALEIHLLDVNFSVRDTTRLLTKAPRRSMYRSLDFSLTDVEFTVLNLLARGFSVPCVTRSTRLTGKQVSMHKCNALRKLNADSLVQLLI